MYLESQTIVFENFNSFGGDPKLMFLSVSLVLQCFKQCKDRLMDYFSFFVLISEGMANFCRISS